MQRLIGKFAAKYVLSQKKPLTLTDLKYSFLDGKGKRYYSWENLSKIPVNRHGELVAMVQYSDAKIAPSTLESLTNELDSIHHSLITEKATEQKRKYHAQMFALSSEIRDRSKFSVPKEVMIRMASILCCREDEQPNEWDEEINDEKVRQFTKDLNNGHDFFLKSPIIIAFYPILLGTSEYYSQTLISWAQDQERIERRLKILSRDQLPKESVKS